MKVEFEIKDVTIIKGANRDKIDISINATTAFPELTKELDRKVYPILRVDTERGYAEKWLKENNIICDISIIEMPKW